MISQRESSALSVASVAKSGSEIQFSFVLRFRARYEIVLTLRQNGFCLRIAEVEFTRGELFFHSKVLNTTFQIGRL